MKIHNGKVTKIKTTKGLLDKYFEKVGLLPKNAKVADIRLVFLMVLEDFESGLIKLNDLSYIATQLYFEVGKPSWFDNIDTELGKSLYEASEATWYKQKDQEKYNRMEKRIHKYFEKNKNLLKK